MQAIYALGKLLPPAEDSQIIEKPAAEERGIGIIPCADDFRNVTDLLLWMS